MFIGIFIFLAGLCVGSFLNVCIYRIPLEKSVVFPPSSCPSCGNQLKAVDMIPILSYIGLKGKCRSCKAPISVQYPIVELVTGILWVLVYLRYGLSFETLALTFFFSLLIPVFLIDFSQLIIPDELVITGLIGGACVFIYHLFKPFALFDSALWYTPLVGMVSASGILFIVAFIGFLIYGNDGAMGMGDVKLFLPIGLFLGWKLSLMTLLLSVILGGVVSTILLIFRIKDRKSAIPFGPFIIISTYISGFYGLEILSWYFNL